MQRSGVASDAPSLGPPPAASPLLRHPAARLSRETRVRGQALRSELAALATLFTEAEVKEIMERLSEDAPAGLSAAGLSPSEISGTAWYPASWVAAIHKSARLVDGAGLELPRQLGAAARRLDARGIYRFILRFVSPESYLANSSRLVPLFVDGPTVTVSPITRCDDGRRRRATMRIDNAISFEENLWADALGSIGAILDFSGAREPNTVQLEGGSSDDDFMVCELSWRG